MAPTESLQQFEKIEEVVARYAFKLSSVRSPAEIYKEKTDEIQGSIAQLWTSLELAPAPEKPSLQDSIVKLGGQLKELEIKYEAGVQDEEKAYSRALREIADAFRYELLEIIGPAKIESYLRSITSENSDRQGSNNAVVTCQPHDATLQAIGAKEACVPKGMPENRHTSPTTTPVSYKRKRTSPESMGRKRRQVEKDDPCTKLSNSIVSCPAVRSSRRRTRHSHRRHGDKRSTTDEDFEGITNPDAGSIYLAFWEKSKDWFAVLLLPMQDLESVGIPGSIESLGLAEVLPRCYCGKQDGFSWAEGFNDGEPLLMEREFPVMYFDGQDFPAQSAVGWVSARDLRQFDANNKNSLIPHIRSVRKFLKTRAEKRSPEREVDRSKSEAPDATEPSSIEANSYPPTPLKVPLQHRGPQMAAPDQDQEEPSSLCPTQPISPSDHVALYGSPTQRQSLPDLRTEEEQQHRLGLGDVAIVCHELGRQLDEPCNLSEPTSTAALSNATQEIRQDADLEVIQCNEKANGTAAPGENMRAGLFGSSGSEEALGDAVCPSHPPPRESFPVEPMTELLETPEFHATDTSLSNPSIPNTSSAALTQPAPLCVPRQHTQLEMGGPHSNRPIINATCPTTKEGQQAHQAPNVVESSNETSHVVVGMPHLRPVPCDAGHPYISQTGALYNFEASKSVLVLPPISSMLGQGVNHLSQEPFNQAPRLTDQPTSFPAPSVRVTTNAPPPPLPPPLLRIQPLTSKLTIQSSAIQTASSQGSTTRHAPALPPQSQSDDSFHTRVTSSSTTPNQHRLTSPEGPTSDSHDGCNTQVFCGLDVTPPKGDWYKKLPRDLTEYLEKYQQDHNLSLGISGLRIQSGHYTCPFCSQSKRKHYVRPASFSSHLARHWASLMEKQ
ncbi:hypothetical protein FOXB_01255 [Fusarium oxysporum f. sp. conglutinans Fo5176]|uniref:Uncharacterized protein n=2 Tax=Fusarium oxysporum f. sp. conglutinans TaxID=100902 RepID=F9F4D0_FUSOF|nr:hypothetical protein FOXB_01255 [Fusarium oxysporum f. sp. conglutinans Fo5176]KAI8416065.1 hypothetical protein FOFC_02374 [Fusarium oxysporum]